MKPFLRQQLERYLARLSELDFLLSREDIMADMDQYRLLSREHADVSVIAGRYARFMQRESDLAAAQDLLADPDMAEMAQEEIAGAQAELEKLAAELQRLLAPAEPGQRLIAMPGAGTNVPIWLLGSSLFSASWRPSGVCRMPLPRTLRRACCTRRLTCTAICTAPPLPGPSPTWPLACH